MQGQVPHTFTHPLVGTHQAALGSLLRVRPACPSRPFQPFGFPLWGATFCNFAHFVNFKIAFKHFFIIIFTCLEVFVHILDANPQRLQKALLPAHRPLFTLSLVPFMQQKFFILMWSSLPVALPDASSQIPLTPSSHLHFPLRVYIL